MRRAHKSHNLCADLPPALSENSASSLFTKCVFCPYWRNMAAESEGRDERCVPLDPIAKMMQMPLLKPVNGKVGDSAKKAMAAAVSEFIAFITSEAADICHHEKRRKMTGDQIICALTNLGFRCGMLILQKRLGSDDALFNARSYGTRLEIYQSKYLEVRARRIQPQRRVS